MSRQNPRHEPYQCQHPDVLESTIAMLNEGKQIRRKLKEKRLEAKRAAVHKRGVEQRLKTLSGEITNLQYSIGLYAGLPTAIEDADATQRLAALKERLARATASKAETERKLQRLNTKGE